MKRPLAWVVIPLALVFVNAGPRSAPRFPDGFLWGAATAAYQVEGGNTNTDWYEWEREGHTKDRAGDADDDYHRYREDLDLARDLNLGAYRLSIEWSRIEPSPGVFSEQAIHHYRKELRAARERGLKTFVTLHHFTNPLWAARRGGWMNVDMPKWFGEYAAHVVPELDELVDFWLTINEPMVSDLESYVIGISPPGVKDVNQFPVVLSNMLKAHALAYHAIHDFDPRAKVGFAHHVRVFDAATWDPMDSVVASLLDDFWNHQIMRAIQTGQIRLSIPLVVDYSEDVSGLAGTLDFIGVNYYTRDLIRFDPTSPVKFDIVPPGDGTEKSDMGWEIYPEGMYRALQAMAQYKLPIYVTENGIADASDSKRANYICSHLEMLARAIADGVDVRGYLHWSLLDNYEWSEGYGPRFGLVAVDYATQERTIRPSARVLAAVAASNTLDACEQSR